MDAKESPPETREILFLVYEGDLIYYYSLAFLSPSELTILGDPC